MYIEHFLGKLCYLHINYQVHMNTKTISFLLTDLFIVRLSPILWATGRTVRSSKEESSMRQTMNLFRLQASLYTEPPSVP